MSDLRLVVLDSSVGVKWIKPERGRAEALALLEEHREGRIRIVVAAHFLHEVVGVAVRHGGPDVGATVRESLRNADLTVVGLDDTVATVSFEQCTSLSCTFYDALAPAIAARSGATLVSADVHAHSGFDGVVLLGEWRSRANARRPDLSHPSSARTRHAPERTITWSTVTSSASSRRVRAANKAS